MTIDHEQACALSCSTTLLYMHHTYIYMLYMQ